MITESNCSYKVYFPQSLFAKSNLEALENDMGPTMKRHVGTTILVVPFRGGANRYHHFGGTFSGALLKVPV